MQARVGFRKQDRARRLGVALVVGAWILAGAPAWAQDSAVILAYQRFAEAPGRLTTTIDQLDAHIARLTQGGYRVLPLSQVVAALAGGLPLPERAVAITIEGGHESVHRLAWPRFKAAGLPITVLVTSAAVDRGQRASMTWDQLREMVSSGVGVGTHGAFYRRQIGRPAAAVVADLVRARARIADELGAGPQVFSYPYGEHDATLRALVAEHGFTAALAQQSGVAHGGSDLFALPRFSVFGSFAEPARFSLVIEALPLPVRDLVPAEPLITTNPPPIGFTVESGIEPLDRLACFAGGIGAIALDRLGERRFELRLKAPLAPGRARINCTMPARDGRWRWLGLHLSVP